MPRAPVVLFVYRRPSHAKAVLESLSRCAGAEESELFIFCDGPGGKGDEESVGETRRLARERRWCGKTHVVERAANLGLADSIIVGVSEVMEARDRVIVLEDDLLLHPQFLNYMNKSLGRYDDRQRVFSVTGFNYSPAMLKIPRRYRPGTYFSYRCHSWGWGTWRNRWRKVDFRVKDFDSFIRNAKSRKMFNRGGNDLSDMLQAQMRGRIDSWAIRFCYAHYKNDAFCLYPVTSLVRNTGFGRGATHTVQEDSRFEDRLADDFMEFTYPDRIEVDPVIARRFRKMFAEPSGHDIRSFLRSCLRGRLCRGSMKS